jgi:hypothetical protein
VQRLPELRRGAGDEVLVMAKPKPWYNVLTPREDLRETCVCLGRVGAMYRLSAFF